MFEPTTCTARCHRDDLYCDNCDLLVGLAGLHVVGVERDQGGGLTVTVESAPQVMGCPACGVVAASHGRRVVRLVDSPCFGRPVDIRWRKRTWECVEASCPVGTFTEQDETIAKPRAMLTARGCRWAVHQIRREHGSVSGIARQLGTAWKTVWGSIRPILAAAAADESRFAGVTTLGVDEHIWHHVSPARRGPKELTGMVDLTRDKDGRTHARLLDLVPGRSGTVYADWLKTRGEPFRKRVQVATLDPFRGYKNAIDDQLADATAVLDAFHVVKLATQAVDEVRRRVQQDIHGHRGRAVYHQNDPATGRALAEKVLAGFPSCPIPEIARLGKTLKQWRDAFLGYFATGGANNGGTEAINGLIELHRRIARGFRNPENYRLRMLLIAGGLDQPPPQV